MKFSIVFQDVKNYANRFTLISPDLAQQIEIINSDFQAFTIETVNLNSAIGQILLLGGKCQFQDQVEDLLMTGKITNIQVLSDEKRTYILKIQEYDRHLWDRIQRTLAETQEQIDQLVRELTGADT